MWVCLYDFWDFFWVCVYFHIAYWDFKTPFLFDCDPTWPFGLTANEMHQFDARLGKKKRLWTKPAGSKGDLLVYFVYIIHRNKAAVYRISAVFKQVERCQDVYNIYMV